MEVDVSIVYAYVYKKIKEKSNGNIIRTNLLKSILYRTIIRKKNGVGLPSYYLYEIIKDLENQDLLKRIDCRRYRILPSKCVDKLRNFPH